MRRDKGVGEVRWDEAEVSSAGDAFRSGNVDVDIVVLAERDNLELLCVSKCRTGGDERKCVGGKMKEKVLPVGRQREAEDITTMERSKKNSGPDRNLFSCTPTPSIQPWQTARLISA